MIDTSEISALMNSVSNAGMTLQDEILQIIADSSEPMCCKDIYERSINAADSMSLSIEVHRMTVKAALLEVAEKKARAGFREVSFYRLTALGREQLRQPGADQSGSSGSENTTTSKKVQPNTEKAPEKVQLNTAKVLQTAVHQPEQKKETPMNAPANPHGGKQPGELNTAIYNKIVEHPGITRAALIKHAQQKCPDATDKQINNTIGNMIHIALRIRSEGERGNYTYHLNTGVSKPQAKPTAPAKSARKAAVGKVVTGKEAAALRGDPQPGEHVENNTKAPFKKPAEPVLSDHQFTMMLSDDNHLHLGIDDEMYTLNPAQTARLHAFLHRVQLGTGAPA